MKSLRWIVTSLCCAVPLLGCIAGGVPFQDIEPGPQDMGVIYFYRPNLYLGSAVDIMLVDNGERIQAIRNGQYIRYLATPGVHLLHTTTAAIDKPLELNIAAGEIYFVRTGIMPGFWVGTWYLTRVYEDEAIHEIRACRSGKPANTPKSGSEPAKEWWEKN